MKKQARFCDLLALMRLSWIYIIKDQFWWDGADNRKIGKSVGKLEEKAIYTPVC